ncbi:hypothetical protein V6Z11_A02G005100 [Gossypium hirsutum]
MLQFAFVSFHYQQTYPPFYNPTLYIFSSSSSSSFSSLSMEEDNEEDDKEEEEEETASDDETMETNGKSCKRKVHGESFKTQTAKKPKQKNDKQNTLYKPSKGKEVKKAPNGLFRGL